MTSEYKLYHFNCPESQTYRTFSLNINKLYTFSEITEVCQWLKVMFVGQMSSHTEF